MDERKRRIMMAIVSLYADDGEPVGSNLLSQYFDMAVSSATLRNEMAALTRLGFLEQPHTSAGRVPTAKGYRFFVDNLLDASDKLQEKDRAALDEAFRSLDYDPEKLVQDAAHALSDLLGYTVIATTPRAEDLYIAHFDLVQVGKSTAAIIAVTAAGGVRTRVAKVDCELRDDNIQQVAQAMNRHLCFVAEADVDASLIRTLVDGLGPGGQRYWPILSAALTLMDEVGKPKLFFEGQIHLLKWPELEKSLRPLLEMMDRPEKVENLLRIRTGQTTVLYGDEFSPHPIPGLCFIARRYLASGGLSGTLALVGSQRMRYRDLIPKLEYFSDLLGQGMSGLRAG